MTTSSRGPRSGDDTYDLDGDSPQSAARKARRPHC